MKNLVAAMSLMLAVPACASTSSVTMPERAATSPKLAIVPFKGEHGPQSVDLIAQEFAKRDLATLVGASVISIIGYDIDFADASPNTANLLQRYSEELDVDFVLTGTVEAIGGPLYPFDHVKMTMRLIDVRTGQTRWIGNYGNSIWTPAISTQGDISRGAKQIAKEFDASGADDLVR